MKPWGHIHDTSTPKPADVDFLTQKINQETPEFGEANPFAFFIRNNHSRLQREYHFRQYLYRPIVGTSRSS
jgi:hypothetical protein